MSSFTYLRVRSCECQKVFSQMIRWLVRQRLYCRTKMFMSVYGYSVPMFFHQQTLAYSAPVEHVQFVLDDCLEH